VPSRRVIRLDFAAVRERDGVVALGEAPTVRAQHERDVGVSGLRQAEEPREQDLARRRVREIGAPHDLAYTLRGIIDHYGELVRGCTVVAAHDEVIHRLIAAPEQAILESYPGILRTDSKCRRTSGCLAFRALGRR
jgi:hypothetical protein